MNDAITQAAAELGRTRRGRRRQPQNIFVMVEAVRTSAYWLGVAHGTSNRKLARMAAAYRGQHRVRQMDKERAAA